MWAKILTQVIITLVTKLASLSINGIKKLADNFKRKKRQKGLQDAAKGIENETDRDAIRNRADDLP